MVAIVNNGSAGNVTTEKPHAAVEIHTAPHRQDVGEVAREQGVKREAVIAANPALGQTPVLAPGDKVKIPQSTDAQSQQYTVQSGDNVESIAKSQNVPVAELRKENGFDESSRLSPGEKINIPDTSARAAYGTGEAAAPVSSSKKSEQSSSQSSVIAQAEKRTDEAAKKVEATKLSDDELKKLSEPDRQKKTAEANKANNDLKSAVEAEIKARTDTPNTAKLTETQYASATAAIIKRVESQPIKGVVTAEVFANDIKHTYEQKGSLEASKRLDALTTEHPELAAQIVFRSQKTIDVIAKKLGDESVEVETAAKAMAGFQRADPQGLHGRQQKQVADFDETVLHLSNASYNASLNEKDGGVVAIDGVASAIAANVPKNDIGRFDEAFRVSVREGGGATLGLAVADKLQKSIVAGGRKDTQADNVVNGIRRGVEDLRKEADSTAEQLGRSHVARLIAGYGQVHLSTKDPVAAFEEFKKENPKEYKAYEELLQKFDKLAAASVRTEQSLQAKLPSSLQKLSHADDLLKEKDKLEKSSGVATGISSSSTAENEIKKIVEGNPVGDASVLNTASSAAGIGKASYEAIGKAYISSQTKKAVALAAGGDIDGALKIVRGFKEPIPAAILGIDTRNIGQAQTAIDKFDAFVRGAKDIKDPRELVALSEGLERDLKGLGFDKSTPLGNVLRGTGLLLSAIGAGQSLNALSKDGAGPREVLSAAASTLGFGKDVSEIFLKDAITEGGVWKGFGKGLAGVGIFLDVVSFSKNMFGKDGDKIDGVFDAASAIGGGFGLAALVSEGAVGGVAGPIGVAITTAAALGKFGYGLYKQTEEINLLENAKSTQKYLVDLGFKPNVAKILSNTNGEGLSPIPTLAAWATEKYGYDLTKPEHMDAFVKYLNDFSSHPKDLDRLVKQAHKVERESDGSFKSEYTQDEAWRIDYNSGLGKGSLSDFVVQSLSGLEYWAKYNDLSGDDEPLPSYLDTPPEPPKV